MPRAACQRIAASEVGHAIRIDGVVWKIVVIVAGASRFTGNPSVHASLAKVDPETRTTIRIVCFGTRIHVHRHRFQFGSRRERALFLTVPKNAFRRADRITRTVSYIRYFDFGLCIKDTICVVR